MISVTVLKQLLGIFPYVKKFNLDCDRYSKIEGSWPSTHYTDLRSFIDEYYDSVVDNKMIPLSLNGYQEL